MSQSVETTHRVNMRRVNNGWIYVEELSGCEYVFITLDEAVEWLKKDLHIQPGLSELVINITSSK